MTESETIKENVRKRYAEVAKRAQASTTASCCTPSTASCCGPTSAGDYAKKIGYALDELSDLPDAAQLASAGCGNPPALASLKEGEVVLDLGSGGGIDIFIAAKKVGPTGKAIGVDMTLEMLDLATKNAEELGIENVEFRKGDIEDLPVEDGTIDVIISNCVINLAPDKDKVFREAYRVLKPGGGSRSRTSSQTATSRRRSGTTPTSGQRACPALWTRTSTWRRYGTPASNG